MTQHSRNPNPTFTCPSCQQKRDLIEQTKGTLIPPKIAAKITQKHPTWTAEQVICRHCVNAGKADEMQQMLEAEMGTLTNPELEVLESVRKDSLLSIDTDDEFERGQGFNERIAHKLVTIVGSWLFAVGILASIATWLLINTIGRPFEPYPIIALAGISAALASLASLQGPIILMSQRYQRQRDRLRSQNDYRINLKAEFEIQYLTEQLEHVLENQQILMSKLTEAKLAESTPTEQRQQNTATKTPKNNP